MRIAIIGTSGAGKTTLAGRLSEALDLPHIEMDAINWQANWRDLNAHDPDEFLRRINDAIAGEAWVCDGNYSGVRRAVFARATDLIWLDFSLGVIMTRVIVRSFRRAAGQTEIWPGTGNRETFLKWLDRDHPIRWAWDTWARRRRDYEALIASADLRSLRIFRLRRPIEAEGLVRTMMSERDAAGLKSTSPSVLAGGPGSAVGRRRA